MVDQEDIWRKLQDMDDKLDNIQGDNHIQSAVMKEDNRDTLRKAFKREFGRSKNRRKVWYHAGEERTTEELAELTGMSWSQIRNHTSYMVEHALLNKAENGDRKVYYRNPATEGIDLEDHVKDYVDDL